MVNTGMRPNEIFKLKWNDVDMKQKYINITDSKNGDPRIIPINVVLYLCLSSLDKANEYVLTHSDGRQVKSNTGAFCSALKKSGIIKAKNAELVSDFLIVLLEGKDISWNMTEDDSVYVPLRKYLKEVAYRILADG